MPTVCVSVETGSESALADGHSNLRANYKNTFISLHLLQYLFIFFNIIACSMARTKTSSRPALSHPAPRPRCRPEIRRMTASGFRPPQPPPPPTKRKMPWLSEDAGISKEVSWLQDDIAANPCPESTQPRQEPAMSRYRGAPLKSQLPQSKVKRCHSCQSQKKAKGPKPLTKPEAPGPLTNTEIPAPRSEVTSPDVIDLTGDD